MAASPNVGLPTTASSRHGFAARVLRITLGERQNELPWQKPEDEDRRTRSFERPAVVLEDVARWPRPAPEFTLDQVLAGLPWKRT